MKQNVRQFQLLDRTDRLYYKPVCTLLIFPAKIQTVIHILI